MDSKRDDEESSATSSLDAINTRVDAFENSVEVNNANTEDFMRRMGALLEGHMMRMEERYAAAFGTLSGDIATANNNTTRVEAELTSRIQELETTLGDNRGTQGNLVPSLPLIQEMVNGAAAALQISVEAINNSTSSEVKALQDKFLFLQERFEETERSERVPPRGPGHLQDTFFFLEKP